MSKEPQHSLKQLDDFVTSYLYPQRTQCKRNQNLGSAGELAITIYQSFLNEVNRLNQNQLISLQIFRGIESHVSQKIIAYSQELQKLNKKRGRPLKNKEGQKNLAEWIKKQKRSNFTKKQINKEYKLIMKTLGKPQKGLSMRCLLRILQNHDINDLSITTKKVGKLSCQLKSEAAHPSHLSDFTGSQVQRDQRQQMYSEGVKMQKFEKWEDVFESYQSNQSSLQKFLNPENDLEFLKEVWSDNYFSKKEEMSDDGND